MRALGATIFLCAAHADAARVSVAIGANVGLEEEPRLHFANTDAKTVDSVMRELGGVSARNAYVLADADAVAIWALLDRVRQRVHALGPTTELFFYFSGHGSDTMLHAGGARLDRARVEQALRDSGALRVIMIIDACRTGDQSLHPVDAAAAMSSPVVIDGFVEIQAAAVDEPAQESRSLGGAVFTHYWTTGLRGAADSNGDGAVTLDEAYRFAHTAMLARPASSLPVSEALPEEVITQISKKSSALQVR